MKVYVLGDEILWPSSSCPISCNRNLLFFKGSCILLNFKLLCFGISSVQSLSHVQLFVTPWTAAHQTSLSIINCQSPLKPMSIESVMPSNHLILCRPPLLLPSIFPSIRVFSNESALYVRWPKDWSFSISPSSEYSGLISFRMDWLDLLTVQGTQESSPTPQFKSINSLALSFLHDTALTSIHDYWKNRNFWLDRHLLAK